MAILAAVRDSNTLETDLPKFISIPVSVLHVLKKSRQNTKAYFVDVLVSRFFFLSSTTTNSLFMREEKKSSMYKKYFLSDLHHADLFIQVVKMQICLVTKRSIKIRHTYIVLKVSLLSRF